MSTQPFFTIIDAKNNTRDTDEAQATAVHIAHTLYAYKLRQVGSDSPSSRSITSHCCYYKPTPPHFPSKGYSHKELMHVALPWQAALAT